MDSPPMLTVDIGSYQHWRVINQTIPHLVTQADVGGCPVITSLDCRRRACPPPTRSCFLDPMEADEEFRMGQFKCAVIETSCCSVKSMRVSLGTLTWSPFVIVSDPAPTPAPTPAPIAAPSPPPARAPISDPKAAPPTVLFAVLAPRDLPLSSYSPVTSGIVCPFTTIPVSSSRSCDLPLNVPDAFDSASRPYTSAPFATTTLPSTISGSSREA